MAESKLLLGDRRPPPLAQCQRSTAVSYAPHAGAWFEFSNTTALEKLRAKNRRVEVEYDLGKKHGPDKAFQKYIDTYRKRLEATVDATNTNLENR